MSKPDENRYVKAVGPEESMLTFPRITLENGALHIDKNAILRRDGSVEIRQSNWAYEDSVSGILKAITSSNLTLNPEEFEHLVEIWIERKAENLKA